MVVFVTQGHFGRRHPTGGLLATYSWLTAPSERAFFAPQRCQSSV